MRRQWKKLYRWPAKWNNITILKKKSILFITSCISRTPYCSREAKMQLNCKFLPFFFFLNSETIAFSFTSKKKKKREKSRYCIFSPAKREHKSSQYLCCYVSRQTLSILFIEYRFLPLIKIISISYSVIHVIIKFFLIQI